MIDWHVKMKVVCVDATGGQFWAIISGAIVEGTIYTVRAVVLCDGHVALRLEEILCQEWFDGEECVFHSRRFRPVVSPQADISVFERIPARRGKARGRRRMNLICHECERSIPADRATSDPAGRWIGFCSMCGAVSIDYGGSVATQVQRIAGAACFLAACWQKYKDAGREEYFAPRLFAMPGVELPIVPRVALPRIEGANRRDARR